MTIFPAKLFSAHQGVAARLRRIPFPGRTDMPTESRSITIQPLTGALGAELSGVQLGETLSDASFATIRQALHDFGVIFFRDQELSLEAQVAFARRFGPTEVHPIVNGMTDYPEVIKVLKPAGESASFGTGWHSDNSFFEKPSLGSVLYGVTIPPYGGDTLFANQYLAYERLSDGLKSVLSGLTAIHSAGPAYTSESAKVKYEGKTAITYRWSDSVHALVEHPVVRTHPETGRKALYVNQMFTQRFKGWTDAESRPLLEYLYEHSTRPDFTCRFRWRPGSVAVWDNRCVQHYAMDDYQEYERLIYRVTIAGEKPL
jgi:taurine dioxygenase